MVTPLVFKSDREFRSRSLDVGYWHPFVLDVLRRHHLDGPGAELTAGVGATYPTFICGEVVVKFFCHVECWHKSFKAELAAYNALSTDPGIAAPRLLSSGQLSDHPDTPWPYLVTTRMPHKSWGSAALSAEQRLSVAVDLGRQIRHCKT